MKTRVTKHSSKDLPKFYAGDNYVKRKYALPKDKPLPVSKNITTQVLETEKEREEVTQYE